MITQTKEKMKAIQIIYNNDVAVLDYLADLQSREPLKQLQRFINFSRMEPHCILAKCTPDKVTILILYKPPFDMNEGDNKLVLFIHDDLRELCKYFTRWVDNTTEGNKEMRKALDDILRLIYYEWAITQDKDVQADFLG